jgi:SAM-dependent methyltransferase
VSDVPARGGVSDPADGAGASGGGPHAVRDAYALRAAEYAAVLGSMDAVHPDDRGTVARWAGSIEGLVLDVGCGPGHWTAFLAGLGRDVAGVDPVPAFVEHARRTYPGLSFEVGTVEHLPADDGGLGGVLAWYSLVHHDPEAVDAALCEIVRVLRPGGRLLVGFFEGPATDSFDHAVVTAWRWPVDELAGRLTAAGLTVLETTTRSTRGQRAHAALVAERPLAG